MAALEPELLTDHFTRWGLANDPFDPDVPRTAFYSGAQRGQIVSQLLHFCQFGSGVLVVESEEGAGKKTILRQIQQQLSIDSFLELDAAILSDPSQIFFQILSRLEPDQPVESLGIGQVLAELRHLLHLDSVAGAGLVVSLANPDLLDDKVVGALVPLLQDSPEASVPGLKLLFWSDSDFTKRLDSLGLFDVAVSDLPIPSLSSEEVKEYLNFLLSESGARESLFTDDECETIWRQSKGLPGRIDAFARAALLRKLPEKPSRRLSTGMPVHYMALLVLLVGALLMTLFYGFDHDIKQSGGSGVEKSIEDEALKEQVVKEEAVKGVVALEVLELKEAKAEGSLISDDEIEESSGGGEVLGQLDDVVAGLLEVPEIVSKDALKEEDNLSVRAQKVSPVGAGAVTDVVQPDVESLEGKAVALGVAIQSPELVASKEGPEAFFLEQSDSAYFLQVLAAGRLESVELFIRRQSNRESLRYYKDRRNGKDWYVVLAGPYETSEKARASIRLLPEEQRKLSPWPRSVKDIKSKIGGNN
jgi:hypothetical protein